MNLERAFKQLGYTENHARIYSFLLERGRSSMFSIAKGTGIPRSSCYEYLPQLLDAGIVSYMSEGKSRLYKPENPEKVITALAIKLESVTTVYKDLSDSAEALIKQYQDSFKDPKIHYSSSVKQIKKILNKVLDTSEEVLATSTSVNINLGLDVNRKFHPDFLGILTQKKIACKEVINYSQDSYRYKNEHQSEFHQIALVRIDLTSANDTIKFTWDDNYAIIDFRREIATVIEDERLVQNIRDHYNFYWSVVTHTLG